MPAPWRYDEQAKHNPFLAQVWHKMHPLNDNQEAISYGTASPEDYK
jgi:hypothetical protein